MMRDLHCPKDIGFENTFDCEDCKAEQFYNSKLEEEGFEDMLDIVQDEIPVDVLEIGGELIEL